MVGDGVDLGGPRPRFDGARGPTMELDAAAGGQRRQRRLPDERMDEGRHARCGTHEQAPVDQLVDAVEHRERVVVQHRSDEVGVDVTQDRRRLEDLAGGGR